MSFPQSLCIAFGCTCKMSHSHTLSSLLPTSYFMIIALTLSVISINDTDSEHGEQNLVLMQIQAWLEDDSYLLELFVDCAFSVSVQMRGPRKRPVNYLSPDSY